MTVGDSASAPDIGNFASRLRAIAQGQETVDVAQLQFLDLADIKHAYGDRWPSQKARIQDAAEAFLRKRIGSSDLLIRGDGGFVVLFSGSMGAESHAVSAQLTHGLNSFFTGEEKEQPKPTFGGAVRSIAAKDIESTFGDLATMASSGEAETSAGFGMPGLEWRFEPVWDVKREILSYWYVSPFDKSSQTRVAGYQFENTATHSSRFVALDEAGLWMAEQALHELVNADRQTLVGSSVHIATLTNLTARTRIFATLDRLDPALNRYRLLKVAGVAPGFPRLYLNEVMSALRSRLPNIMIGAAWDEPDIAALVRSGPVAIGLSVPPSAVTSEPMVAVPALTARIAEAVKEAHAGRVRLFVEGAVAKYLALKLAGVGVDNIASSGIWPARPMAEGLVKWPASQLMAA